MADFAGRAQRWRVPLHFLLAALVVVFSRPIPHRFIAGTLLVVLGLAVRAWAAGHLRRDSPLTTSGPYAYVRHPLYLGTAIVLIGFGVAASTPWLALPIGLYFGMMFIPVSRREEEERRAGAA